MKIIKVIHMNPFLFKIRPHCFLTEKFQIWEKHLALPKTSITVMQCQLGQMGPVQSTPPRPPVPRCIPPRPLTALSQRRKAFSLSQGTQSLPQASPPSFPCPSTPHLMVKPSVRQEAGSAFAKRHLSGTREPRARSLANRGSAEHQDKPELSSPA